MFYKYLDFAFFSFLILTFFLFINLKVQALRPAVLQTIDILEQRSGIRKTLYLKRNKLASCVQSRLDWGPSGQEDQLGALKRAMSVE